MIRAVRPSRRARRIPSTVAKDITPNPPIWIRARITACPNGVQ
jgi:hypothetical protein